MRSSCVCGTNPTYYSKRSFRIDKFKQWNDIVFLIFRMINAHILRLIRAHVHIVMTLFTTIATTMQRSIRPFCLNHCNVINMFKLYNISIGFFIFIKIIFVFFYQLDVNKNIVVWISSEKKYSALCVPYALCFALMFVLCFFAVGR